MSGGPPKYKITAKRKDDKNAKPIALFALFDAKYGMNALPERPYNDRPGVASITMTDGRVLTLSEYWLNVEAPRKREDDGGGKKREEDDSDIPF